MANPHWSDVFSTLGQEAGNWSDYFREEKKRKAEAEKEAKRARSIKAAGAYLKTQPGMKNVPTEGLTLPEMLSLRPKEPKDPTAQLMNAYGSMYYKTFDPSWLEKAKKLGGIEKPTFRLPKSGGRDKPPDY